MPSGRRKRQLSPTGRGFPSPVPVPGLPRTGAPYIPYLLVKGKQGGREEERKARREGEKEEKKVPGGVCFARNSHRETQGVGKKSYAVLYTDIFTIYSYSRNVALVMQLPLSV